MSINPHFKIFLGLSEAERRIAYESAADMLNTSDKYIEKDLWTCHVLDALFNTVTTERTRLLFKGGTSLSKGYNVIQRFSEDIDITVFREDMGFAGDNDPANPAMSNNQRRKLVQALVCKTAEYIQGDLRNTLLAELHDCHLRVDPKDDEGMTLLVEYDSLYENAPKEYIQPHIKIEGGARSALEPHSLQAVSPYIQSQLEDIDLCVTGITTIDAERTFRRQGRAGGRKRKMDDSKIAAARRLLQDGVSPRKVAKNLGVSIPTLYRWVPASQRLEFKGNENYTSEDALVLGVRVRLGLRSSA